MKNFFSLNDYIYDRRQCLVLSAGAATVGAFAIGIGAMGLAWWHGADYFHHKGPYSSDWVGYDVFTFVGLLLFTIFSSTGITLLYVGFASLMRLWSNSIGLFAFGALGVLFLVLGSLGMIWGNETMQCLGVFCVNVKKYKEIARERPEAGYGFLSVVGITAFFSLVPMGLIVLAQVVIRATRLNRRWLDSSKQRLTIGRNFSAVYAAVAFVLLVCFVPTTFYVPNSTSQLTAPRIAKRARLVATDNHTLCRTFKQNFTCPELPRPFVSTRNWVWSDSVVLKLYPSNLFFFSYLLLLLLTVTAVRATRTGRSFLKRRCPSLLRGFTYGEVCFAALTTLMLSLFFAYWLSAHNFKGRHDGTTDGTARSDRWARAIGQLAVAFLSLCVFPASRYSVLHSILGTSWESSLWAHKVLGYGMLLAATAHMIAWYVRYGELGLLPQAVLSVPTVGSHLDNYTVPLISLVTWFMLVAVGVFALEPVRRRFFELFYYLHIASFYMIVPCVLWHAAASWEYFLPGLTVWFVDRLLRMHRSASTVEVVSAAASGSIVEIRFRHTALSAGPGQYAFVNIPELSLLEWHPFSFSGAGDEYYTFHIKSMGAGTWTGRLVQLVDERGGDFTLSVDGPCGRVQDFADYKAVVLVAGGIGVTPCASIYCYFRNLMCVTGKRPAVTLLWALRDVEMLPLMSHFWENREPADSVFSDECRDPVMPLRLFLTGRAHEAEVDVGESVQVVTGRPNLQEEVLKATHDLNPRDVLVFACGPPSLVKSAANAARLKGTAFHTESFQP